MTSHEFSTIIENPKNPSILAVDDDETSLRILSGYLKHFGYRVVAVANAEEALQLLDQLEFDLLVSDLRMPGMDGMELLEELRKRQIMIPFVVVTACGSIESAVAFMQKGGCDYLEKPYSPDTLHLTVQRALKYNHILAENCQIKAYLKERFTFQNIITVSPTMKATLEIADKVAQSPMTTVSINGESGTGKEVLARAIHFASNRLPGSFIAVNCAAIPDALLESELFGHVRGAFTGAEKDREGKFSLARGGTLFLDEIGDMPLALQAKLLRVLEERTFEKVGSNVPVAAEFRVIVATHRNLAEMVRQGEFREDLYHRVNVVPLAIPPLRERVEDIPLLVEHFLSHFRNHQGKSLPGISKKALSLLISYQWPGNIRELRNVLEYAAILVSDELIRPEHLRLPTVPVTGSSVKSDEYAISLTDDMSLEAITERVLELTLQRCKGNKSQAATLLKVDRKRFYR